MSSGTFGLIVEGPSDKAMYEALIPRIYGTNLSFKTRVCNGVSELNKKFPVFLRNLETVLQGRPVDKVIVIRDSGGKDPTALEAEMADRIQRMEYTFPRGIKFCAVRRTMETWLLADAQAITDVARARGGRQVQEVHEILEHIEDPKQKLRSLLSDARIELTDVVRAEIAARVRIDRLENLCPSFRTFKQNVIDC